MGYFDQNGWFGLGGWFGPGGWFGGLRKQRKTDEPAAPVRGDEDNDDTDRAGLSSADSGNGNTTPS